MITLGRVVAAEVHKVGSLRSYRLTVAVAALAVVGGAGALAAMSGEAKTWQPQSVALPMEYFAYVAMIIGALMVTGEVSAGTAALTGYLVPWQSRAVLGKYLAGGGLAMLAAVVVGALVLIAALVGSGAGPSSAFAGEATAVALSGVAAVPVAAVLGVAFGILVRSTAAAVSLLLVWSFLVETVLVVVLPERVSALLPFKTIGQSRLMLAELSAGEGLAVFALYTAAVVALAAVANARRDAPAV